MSCMSYNWYGKNTFSISGKRNNLQVKVAGEYPVLRQFFFNVRRYVGNMSKFNA